MRDLFRIFRLQISCGNSGGRENRSRPVTGTPASLSALHLPRHGSAEALLWRDDLPVPRPGAGEVLVRVLAAGVAMTDITARIGWHLRGEGRAAGWAGEIRFPRSQGSDLCGRVVAPGAGVEGLPIGARVICPTSQPEPTRDKALRFVAIGSEHDGAFAQYCVVPARHLHDVTPQALAEVEIGAMPCAYGTAHNLLQRARVAVGERVLVTGASGGVGLAAVQLALLAGAEVVGQCSPGKAQAVRQMGAKVLDRDSPTPRQGFDVVIDIVGGPSLQHMLDALKAGGRYATSGAVGGPVVQGDQRTVYLNDLTIYGAAHQPREVFAGLVTIITTARIRPVFSQTHTILDKAQAPADLAGARSSGRLVLISTETDT